MRCQAKRPSPAALSVAKRMATPEIRNSSASRQGLTRRITGSSAGDGSRHDSECRPKCSAPSATGLDDDPCHDERAAARPVQVDTTDVSSENRLGSRISFADDPGDPPPSNRPGPLDSGDRDPPQQAPLSSASSGVHGARRRRRHRCPEHMSTD